MSWKDRLTVLVAWVFIAATFVIAHVIGLLMGGTTK